MLFPKTDFLGTGPILYVCESVWFTRNTNILPQFTMYVINHLCHHEPQSHSTCNWLDLSAAHCDQITSVVEYHVCKSKLCRPLWHAILCEISPGCSCLLMSNLRNTWHKWMNNCANMIKNVDKDTINLILHSEE